MVYAEQRMLLSGLLQIPHKLFSYPNLRAAVPVTRAGDGVALDQGAHILGTAKWRECHGQTVKIFSPLPRDISDNLLFNNKNKL